jgi:two-component system response regulator AtoC
MAAHRILVVDHASNIRCALAQLLTDEGFEVMTANDENEALDAARSLHPAAILVEVESEAGLATIERLSKLADLGQIIALAPHRNLSLALDAMNCGAMDYLFNPVSGIELLVVIRSAIAQYELARELAELRYALAHRYDRCSQVRRPDRPSEPRPDPRDHHRTRSRPSSAWLRGYR